MAVKQVHRGRRGRAPLITTALGLVLAAAVPAAWAATTPPSRQPADASIVALTAPPTTIDIQNVATTCQDLPDRRTATQVLHDAARTSRTAAVFGTEVTAGSPCPHWPARVPVPPHKLRAPGVAPILVVGITNDTAGPYRWSAELVAQLGNARLLTFDGIGHGAYLLDPCVRDAANAFLADGTLPPRATVCRPA